MLRRIPFKFSDILNYIGNPFPIAEMFFEDLFEPQPQ